MNKYTDVDLYTMVREKQDKQALELLYDRYERMLYSFIYRMTNSSDLAEEVIQEVFMKLWKGNRNYDSEKGKFSSWVFTIARNTAIDVLRKQKREPLLEEEQLNYFTEISSSIEEQVEWKEEKGQVHEAIATLSDGQKQMIDFVYFKGFTQQKIAELCDIPIGTVKGRVRLALKHLRSQLLRTKGREE
ncbi:RNA polymerase sigma factor [Peribacillus frigoritolerans]|uniref:Sigma-70 family RNA polymerase sigma factor n=1 Tax=Peribacillus castrilensis TaxID=2897690 RepID=A0AAW9NIE1_9BACI|nr:sigma-70 family RNA polymerase sigma factor [Peribacillus castrilensis]